METKKEQFQGFDDFLKDLRPEVKDRAIGLAADYQRDGMDETIALKKAIAEAELWFLDRRLNIKRELNTYEKGTT